MKVAEPMSQSALKPDKASPAASGTTNGKEGSCVNAPCDVLSLTYAFERAQWSKASESEKSIRFDVAVAVNGKVIALGGKDVISAERIVSIPHVKKGDKVGLYFHHDAQGTHPVTGQPMRNHLVWEVELDDHPAFVTIKEKRGLLNTDGKLTKGKLEAPRKGAEQVQYYEGTLDGNIWLNGTRRYNGDCANQVLDTNADARLRSALITFFEGNVTETHAMSKDKLGNPVQGDVTGAMFSAMLSSTVKIHWPFAGNCKQNIVGFGIKDHIQTVHPQTVLAVLEAMVSSDVHTVELSSGWRPLLGSMQHRDGTGLDVASITYVDRDNTKNKTIVLNRQALEDPGRSSGTDTVSKDEYDKFEPIRTKQQMEARQMQLTKVLLPAAEESAKKARAELNALQTKARSQTTINETAHAALAKQIEEKEAEQKVLQDKVDALELDRRKTAKELPDAIEAAHEARPAWERSVDEHMPLKVRAFRDSLLLSNKVRQVLDPWYMDTNTTDIQGGHITQKANDQTGALEKLHNNHLHIGARHAQAQ
jgi:hypothetical protein